MAELRVLTWNLFHGRSVPETRGPLFDEFAATLVSWDWHVALLQEVFPWWPPMLAGRCGAEQRAARTSRNLFLPVTRWIADRRPDLIKSWGGGSNAILVRERAILDHRRLSLRRRPERRVVHAVRLDSGLWVANLHASSHGEDPAVGDVALARSTALSWAGEAPLLLGGDFNVRSPQMPGFTHAAGGRIDHVYSRGAEPAGPGIVLEHGILSDHPPVLARISFPVPQPPGGRQP